MSLRAFLRREQTYLREIPHEQRGLLGGSFFYALSAPVLTVFSNTYLWRQSPDPIILALYNIGFFLGLPLGFFFNGWLLRRFASDRLYVLGCVLQGLVPITLVLLQAEAGHFAFPLGLALGISAGFYWGNRNYLTSRHTVGPKRFKFLSVEMTAVTTAGILSPILTGWFLVLGEQTGWYRIQTAYEFVALFAMVMLIISGWSVARAIQTKDTLSCLRIQKPTRDWNRLRLIEFLNGSINGFEAIIPIVILLVFVGLEDSIGVVKSYTAILSAISLYVVGRRIKHHHHAHVLGLWTLVSGLGRASFALFTSTFGALAMYTTDGFSNSWRWASSTAVMFETVEKETSEKESLRYAYIVDREAFLNIGRVATLFLFILLYRRAPEATIRYGLLLMLIPQLLLTLLTRQQTKILHQTKT